MEGSLSELICQRVSYPRLSEPVPSPEVLARIYQSALRAPDHMLLRSSRYLVIQGSARAQLGELFCEVACSDDANLSQATRDKYRAMPLRAPMILVGISSNREHAKVPAQEQVLSCGVGMGYMLLALNAEGFGGIWRTGFLARHPKVKAGLGLDSNETLVGFLYLGTPQGQPKPLPNLNIDDYFQCWP